MKLRTACRTLGSGASALHAEHALLLSCFPNMPLPLHSSLGNSSGSKTPVPSLSQPSQPSTWFLLGRENMVTMQQTHIPNLYVWELCDPEVTTQEKSDASCAQARKAAAVKDNLQHSCLMLTLDLCQQIHQSITKLYKHSEVSLKCLTWMSCLQPGLSAVLPLPHPCFQQIGHNCINSALSCWPFCLDGDHWSSKVPLHVSCHQITPMFRIYPWISFHPLLL